MTLRELRRATFQGENENVEFKKKVNHPEKVVREVVAFANSSGGNLLVGVGDDGELSGLKFPDEEEFVLSKAISELCRPKISFEIEHIVLPNNRVVLNYTIPPSPKKPHFALLKPYHRRGKAYVRVEDKSIQASREIRSLLKYQKQNVSTSVTYGDDEKKLFNYLGSHDHVTLPEFCQIASITRNRASEIVLDLALNNMIKILPREKEDWLVFPEYSV